MTFSEIINLIAILFIPILAVIIAQFLQNRHSVRKERVDVFKILMSYRNLDYTDKVCVESLNLIPVLFEKNKSVMKNYNDFVNYMNTATKTKELIEKIEISKIKLLESMAKVLKYKKINWETIKISYMPPKMIEEQEKGEDIVNKYRSIMSALYNLTSPENLIKFQENLDLSLLNEKKKLEKESNEKK